MAGTSWKAPPPTAAHLDLNRGGAPVRYAKPASVVSLFKNDRWRKYSENYLFVTNAWMRPYYCNYLLRIWHENPAHAPLRHLSVVYMKEVSLPDYQSGQTRARGTVRVRNDVGSNNSRESAC